MKSIKGDVTAFRHEQGGMAGMNKLKGKKQDPSAAIPAKKGMQLPK